MEFQNSKILTIGLIVLVIANLAAITFFLLGAGHRKPFRGDPQTFIEKQLDLDPSQQRAYESLVTGHKKAGFPLRNRLRALKDEYFSLLSDERSSAANRDSLLQKMAVVNRQMDEVTFLHFKAVRQLCSPQQKQKFDVIIGEVLNKMSGPPRPRGEGEPPPGPQPIE